MLTPVLDIAFKLSSFLRFLGNIVLLNTFSFVSFDFLSGDFYIFNLSQLFDFDIFCPVEIVVSFEFAFGLPLLKETFPGEVAFLRDFDWDFSRFSPFSFTNLLLIRLLFFDLLLFTDLTLLSRLFEKFDV